MDQNSSASGLDDVLAEQQAFYRSVADEYDKHYLDVPGGGELLAALDALRPTGEVLELACGPGTYTGRLLRHADAVTAIDGSAEMVEIASLQRFEAFWSMVRDCLEPAGRAMFIDDAHRTAEGLVFGDESELVRRRLIDGTQFTVVKVPHEPEGLRRRIANLGWDVTVTGTSGPFYWGVATPADP